MKMETSDEIMIFHMISCVLKMFGSFGMRIQGFCSGAAAPNPAPKTARNLQRALRMVAQRQGHHPLRKTARGDDDARVVDRRGERTAQQQRQWRRATEPRRQRQQWTVSARQQRRAGSAAVAERLRGGAAGQRDCAVEETAARPAAGQRRQRGRRLRRRRRWRRRRGQRWRDGDDDSDAVTTTAASRGYARRLGSNGSRRGERRDGVVGPIGGVNRRMSTTRLSTGGLGLRVSCFRPAVYIAILVVLMGTEACTRVKGSGASTERILGVWKPSTGGLGLRVSVLGVVVTFWEPGERKWGIRKDLGVLSYDLV
ncbi:hypothetical protein Scep_030619 [Stephania cephalantha]|uniref:Uncharacterized protein n=1 Tax=Stephania cephalantha TaxID=152367 RepID=A0AAP0HDB1_9MAGN